MLITGQGTCDGSGPCRRQVTRGDKKNDETECQGPEPLTPTTETSLHPRLPEKKGKKKNQ